MTQIHSIIDLLNSEEKAVLNFFQNNPGRSWVRAARALRKDETSTLGTAMSLQSKGYLSMHPSDELMTFTPRPIERRSIQYPESKGGHQ